VSRAPEQPRNEDGAGKRETIPGLVARLRSCNLQPAFYMNRRKLRKRARRPVTERSSGLRNVTFFGTGICTASPEPEAGYSIIRREFMQ